MSTATETSYAKDLRASMEAKRADIENISASFKDETGKGQFVITSEQKSAYQGAIADLKEMQDLYKAETEKKAIFDFLDAPAGSPVAGQVAQQSHQERKSLGEALTESDVFQEMKASGFRQLGGVFGLETSLYDLDATSGRKDLYSASGGSISVPGFGTPQNVGWTPRMLRPGRVRDLFPTESTTAPMLYGMRETGFTNNARAVAERTAANGGPATGGPTDVYGLKPMSQISMVPVTYPIATIAHLATVHKNLLADEPRLRSYLDRDMIDGVKMAEDDEILYGDGTGENLTGLFNTPGVQTYTGNPTDRLSAQIRRAATRAFLAYFQPSGLVMHPFDFEDFELEQDNYGQYTVAVSVAVGGEKRAWRMPVIETPAMREGNFLLGAFGTAAKLYDREQVNVQISTEDSDNFRRNAVTIRAEERVGLEVSRPEAFVVGTITPYAAA